MTREEQIEQKAKELGQKYFPNENNVWARPNYEAQYVECACKEMVEWADEHPNLYSVTRKAVERERKHLIDKICDLLDKEMEDYMEYYNDEHWPTVISSNYDYKKDFIEAFRKAMEE